MIEDAITSEQLSAKVWRFERGSGDVLADRIKLRDDGTIFGHHHENEVRWTFVGNRLAFLDVHGGISTIFHQMSTCPGLSQEPRLLFRGHFRNTDSEHVLRELDAIDERIDDAARTVSNVIMSRLLGRNDDCFDLVRIASLVGAFEAADYFSKHMRAARLFADREALLDHACSLVTTEGLCMEFGVASGQTITRIARNLKRQIFGFDCFTGLPTTWRPGFEAGTFSQALPTVPENVELIPGLFEDSLPKFESSHAKPVSFMHIDCDLYTSANVVFKTFAGGIHAGTIILFDEYINYTGWQHDEFRAFQEFIRREERSYEYVGLVADHQQVCIRMTS